MAPRSARTQSAAPYLEDAIHDLKGLPYVADIRNFGLVGAIQLDPYPSEPTRRSLEIGIDCWERGLYVRFSGDCLALAPPFTAEKEDLDFTFNVLSDVLRAQS
jgi:beta-alanine--pyruvate transaminase